jgi:hypothetical protein
VLLEGKQPLLPSYAIQITNAKTAATTAITNLNNYYNGNSTTTPPIQSFANIQNAIVNSINNITSSIANEQAAANSAILETVRSNAIAMLSGVYNVLKSTNISALNNVIIDNARKALTLYDSNTYPSGHATLLVSIATLNNSITNSYTTSSPAPSDVTTKLSTATSFAETPNFTIYMNNINSASTLPAIDIIVRTIGGIMDGVITANTQALNDAGKAALQTNKQTALNTVTAVINVLNSTTTVAATSADRNTALTVLQSVSPSATAASLVTLETLNTNINTAYGSLTAAPPEIQTVANTALTSLNTLRTSISNATTSTALSGLNAVNTAGTIMQNIIDNNTLVKGVISAKRTAIDKVTAVINVLTSTTVVGPTTADKNTALTVLRTVSPSATVVSLVTLETLNTNINTAYGNLTAAPSAINSAATTSLSSLNNLSTSITNATTSSALSGLNVDITAGTIMQNIIDANNSVKIIINYNTTLNGYKSTAQNTVTSVMAYLSSTDSSPPTTTNISDALKVLRSVSPTAIQASLVTLYTLNANIFNAYTSVNLPIPQTPIDINSIANNSIQDLITLRDSTIAGATSAINADDLSNPAGVTVQKIIDANNRAVAAILQIDGNTV